MRPIGDPLRKGISVGIALLMLGSSMTVPLIERADIDHRTVAESHHEPGSCPAGHDHTICTQVGANLAFGSEAVEGPLTTGSLVATPLRGARAFHAVRVPRANSSRAPPLA